MTRLLYITNRSRGSAIGGREQLSRLNAQILHQICGDAFESVELDGDAGIEKIFGYIDGVSGATIRRLCNHVRDAGVRQLFLDGSNLGKLAKAIKTSCPHVEVLTFFHNCEARFFLGALRRSMSLKALAVLVSNYLAERSAVRWSDKRICLSQRDSDQLRSLYGRGATHVSAMAMPDKLSKGAMVPGGASKGRYALFVGGAFYANQAGIEWYCDKVAPHAPLPTYVVGKGMAAMKERLERHGNVIVIGEVDDLAPWYLGAHVVVAPIFDGSGMKTKVAEALMFGKRVIGTPEAFSGYEEIASQVGVSCIDAGEFVEALASAVQKSSPVMDRQLRRLYEERYSSEAANARMKTIFDVYANGTLVGRNQ